LACVALPAISAEKTRAVFEHLFEKYGLPELIRTDNGTPFAGYGLWGLTTVSAHWLKYGVRPERSRPGKPQDNGRHERFHRTLKEATALPPRRTLHSQQRAFDDFCDEYNDERPHEALQMKTPSTIYEPSKKKKPARPQSPKYPGHFYVARTNCAGMLPVNGVRFIIGTWASEIEFGLEEFHADRFRVHFGNYQLGELDLRAKRVVPYGRLSSDEPRSPAVIGARRYKSKISTVLHSP
jgi:hypothetical protein